MSISAFAITHTSGSFGAADMTFATTAPFCVFLDTEVYRSVGFDWSQGLFSSLRTRVKRGSIRLVTTDVVTRELHKSIRSYLNEFDQHLQKAARHAGVVRANANHGVAALLQLVTERPAPQAVLEQADNMLRELETETLGMPTTALAEVFNLYFSGAAPFGSRHKKAEFPDAANLMALLAHARENRQAIYVVSADDDWKRTCEKYEELIHCQRLGEILDRAIRAEWLETELRSDEELLWLLRANSEPLRVALQSGLQSASSVDFGDGDLDDLEIGGVSLESISITDAWQDGDLIFMRAELDHGLHYHACVSMADDEFMSTIEAELEGEASLLAMVDLNIRADGKIEILGADYIDGLSLRIPMKF